MDVRLCGFTQTLQKYDTNIMQADETDSVDSFEAVGFKTVKHQRVPDDEMPDILYSIQFCSSTGRLMESKYYTHLETHYHEQVLTNNSTGERKAPRSQGLQHWA